MIGLGLESGGLWIFLW